MPFQPGILFSVALLVLCLGINLTYYPKVRGMFHESGKEVSAASSEQPVLKDNKPNLLELPSLPQNQVKKENYSQSSVPAIPVKTSKVNKPIQPDPLQERPKEKEKNSQTFEKKSETFQTGSKPDKLNTNSKEPQKDELTPKLSEQKQSKPKQLESKQPESKPLEPKQSEPKQSESKQSEPKQPEPKQPESKQQAISVPAVSPLPSSSNSKTTSSFWDEIKSPVTSEPLPAVSRDFVTKKAENIIPKKAENNSETAFLPIVPPSLEKEYWESADQSKNQLAIFASQKTIPELQAPVLKPSEATPAYANAYQEPKQVDLPAHDKINPVQKNKPQPPTFIWETIDSALERPLMYETP
ncbi:MAG: hypothetical protein LBC20_09300 [Planctomycetaceae bacterium]|jgi:hypothetical protein|nr:hypothetical protein [Planctomycetaceae bacterium]